MVRRPALVFGLVVQPHGPRGGYRPRRQGVDADAARPELGSQCLGQGREGPLDRAVERGVGIAALGHRRTHVDQGGGAIGLHVRQQRLAAPQRALDADAQHLIGDRFGDRRDRLVAQQHGVVDDGVEAVVLPRRTLPAASSSAVRSATSAAYADARPPAARICSAASRTLPGSMSISPTAAPWRASRTAIAPPEAASGAGDQYGLLGQLSDRWHECPCASQGLVEGVDQPGRTRTVGAHGVHPVRRVREPDPRVRVGKAEGAADAVVAEGAQVRAHVDRLGGIQQDAERLVVGPVLHEFGDVVLLGGHRLDGRRARQPYPVELAAAGESAVDPRHAARIAVAVAAGDLALAPDAAS